MLVLRCWNAKAGVSLIADVLVRIGSVTPVGMKPAKRCRISRYEVRRWTKGYQCGAVCEMMA